MVEDVLVLERSLKSNKSELKYREEIQQTEEDFNSFEKWIARVNDGRIDYLKEIMKKVKFEGEILEIGAGSTWFGSELSKLEAVKKVYCLDLSEKIIREIAPKVREYLKADDSKIVPVVGDFYNLDFKEKSFDMVVVDAALHHIEDMDHVLNEIKKVLKDEGMVVAIREPVLPKLRKGARKKFGAHERSLGVTENIFTKEEWVAFFSKNGFELSFIPLIPKYNLKYKIIGVPPFKYLNGLLFGHYVFVIRKKLS